jgi:serine/threonine-protein kinase
VSQVISRVIHKAIAKQPWNRFSTAKEFGETLVKAQRNEVIEIFDTARLQPRIQKATKAYEQGNFQFAAEILNELEAEGHVETNMTLLRRQLDQAVRQKTIGQLLDSARNCMDEEEYLLALQKIQEILQLDPTNSSALSLKGSIETRRSEAKVEEWVKLARQHLENNAFSHAREALQNLLQLRPKDTTALQLLAEADRREEAYVKARKQKEELYKLALEAWQNGEMSSALTKLERLVDLDKRVPDTSAPERGISYQNFYNQVRTEHDVLQSSYQEARKHLVDGNFTSALSICEQYLNKYPGHALFQALKFDVEERHRQELSSRIAEIDRSVESEPDIDRRVSILKEALRTYPGEPHFEKALRLVRDKRDLVNSIVAKAHAYDERGQFTEALGQWEILQTIHKQYPGLDFEIDRIRKRRDQQSRNEAKARWVEQIDRQLEGGDYERAIELLKNAETEFPGDPEMTALGELARQSQTRAAEAAQIFSQGQELSSQRRFDEAIEHLRRASDMDPHNRVIRAFLLETLLEHARAVLDTDWHAAEALSQQALDLDPDHGVAKSIRTMAADRKREEQVGQWVAEARRNQAAGNVQAALAQIEQGLAAYPREPRLTQLHATLCKAIPDLQSRAEAVARGTAITQHEAAPKATPGAADTAPAGWQEFEEKLRAQTEGAANAETLAASAGLAGGPVAASGPPVDYSAETQVIARSPAEAEAPPANVARPAPGAELGATMLFQAPAPDVAAPPPAAPAPPAPAAVQPPKKPPAAQKEAKAKIQPPPGPAKPVNKTLIGVAAGAVVVLIAAWFIASAFRPVTIEVQTNPPGATIRINNEVRGTSNLSLKLRAGTYQLLAEKDGYISAHMPLVVKRGSAEPIKLSLQAAPPPPPVVELHQVLRLSSDLQSGKVKVDAQPSVELTDGQLPDQELAWGKHDIEVSSGSARTSLTFEAASGRPPVLAEAPKTKELNAVVVTSLGNQVHIQASQSSTPVKVTVDKQDLGELGAGGLDLPSLPLGNHEVVLNDGKNPHTLNITTSQAPVLQIQLYSDRNVGSVLIHTGEDDVTVEVDGKPTKRKTRGGQVLVNLGVKQHSIRVFKNGFLDEPAQTVEVKKGEEAKLEFHLRPVPTVAGLTIHGAAPGLQVTLDQKHVGTVANDGSLSLPGIAPGNHTIDLSDGRRHKQFVKDLKAGETLILGPPDVTLQALKASVRITVSPANAAVSYKGPDGKAHEVRGPSVELEEGPYMFSASAPTYNDGTQTLIVASNKPNTVVLTLAKQGSPAPRGPVTMEQWAANSGWKTDESWFVHHGGGLVLYPAVPSSGTFIFTALRQGGILGSGRIQWVAGCIESTSNYVLFGIDKKNIHRVEMEGGKKIKNSEKSTALKTPAGKELQYNIKVDISSGGVTTSVQQGNDWVVVDNWSASGVNPANGKFGFFLPGTDELYISHFSFTPK